MTIDTKNQIIARAKGKKDGVYSFRGVIYRVKDGAATHFAYDGGIYLNGGWVNVSAGTYEYSHQVKKVLKAL